MFNKEIFRKKALDRLSTPDDLDELLQVNSKSSWLLLVSLLCLIFAGIIWGVFGRIVNKVTLIGAIQPVDPPLSLIADEPGIVDSIFHWPGDKVIQDQPIIGYLPENGGKAKYLLSPVSGELVELNIRKGVFLTPGYIAAKVSKNQHRKIIRPEFLFFVSDKKVSSLTIGQTVTIRIQGLVSKSILIESNIIYISKLPASDESIMNVIFNAEIAAQLRKGSFYLVRTANVPSSDSVDPFVDYSVDDLYGKVCYGEAIVSQSSPIAYLLSPSK